MKNQLNCVVLYCTLGCLGWSNTAIAEVFTCKEANGQMVFSHLPCESKQPEDVEKQRAQLRAENRLRLSYIDAKLEVLERSIAHMRVTRQEELELVENTEKDIMVIWKAQNQIRKQYSEVINISLDEVARLRNERVNLTRSFPDRASR